MNKLSRVNNQMFPHPLSKEEEADCLRKFCELKDEESRDTLISRNLRLVGYIARKFIGNIDASFNFEDIVSVGTIGLIKAINSFKLGLNVTLATYSSRCIENEILMFLRKTKKHHGVVSLEAPIELYAGDKPTSISETVSDGFDFTEQVENNVVVDEMKKKLSERELQTFEMRFEKELPQRVIAEELGLSQSFVSRLNKKVITKLQEQILESKNNLTL